MKTQWVCALAVSLLACSIAQALAQDTSSQQSSNNPATNTTSSGTDQQSNSTTPPAKPKKLQAVQVTGSLIPQAQIEGASPVTTVTAADIEKKGFVDTYDALRSLPVANGSVQDPQFTGGYTPAAKTISLFGLSPDFTLTLLNGRPMASYPLAYNGSVNITDIANIPVGLIDRIDVLTGGQSSIYGSAAIAGVVNIVLKDHIEGTHIDLRYGGYTEGGGESKRLQLSSGHSWGDFSISGGVQLSKQDPIWGYQRSYIKSVFDDPDSDGWINSRTFLRADPTTDQYINPGAAACAPLSYMFGSSTSYSYRPGHGYYCGSPDNVSDTTLANQETDANGLLQLRYKLNDHTELYSDTLYSYSNPTYVGGSPFWNQTFYNKTTGQYEEWQRIFAPEEIGSSAADQHVFTTTYNFSAGVRGSIGDSDWNYDAYYNRSQSNVVREAQDFLTNNGIQQYYLGQQLGTDPNGYPIYAPNLSRLYQPLSPQLFNEFTGDNSARSVSWTQNETITANTTSLFSLPSGDVGAALIAQTSNQRFSNASASPEAAEGYFLGQTGSTTAAGQSEQYALGGEMQLPLLKSLTADVSTRYDKYLYGGNKRGKPTYKLGLEYRPLDNLLVRGSYATAFRAPDLFYLFSARDSGYSSATDYYQCRLAGYNSSNYNNCPVGDQSIYAVTSGNTGLKDITAKTFTYGFVWSTLDNRLSLSLDYDDIRVSNEVVTLSTDEILQEEADCRLGKSESGVAYDINSPTCQEVLGEVVRYPESNPVNPGGIEQVNTYPINVASEHQTGIQTALKYKMQTNSLGSFDFEADYYDEFSHTYQEKQGDPTLNYLCCGNNDEFKSRISGSATWTIGKFSSTLYGIRDGNTWNSLGTRPDIGPWITFNGSVAYKVTPKTTVAVTANNIFNKRPPMDSTNEGWPYFDVTDYNALGRSVYLNVGFDLGI
jgi:iron complex outermembrane recepter protein